MQNNSKDVRSVSRIRPIRSTVSCYCKSEPSDIVFVFGEKLSNLHTPVDKRRSTRTFQFPGPRQGGNQLKFDEWAGGYRLPVPILRESSLEQQSNLQDVVFGEKRGRNMLHFAYNLYPDYNYKALNVILSWLDNCSKSKSKSSP